MRVSVVYDRTPPTASYPVTPTILADPQASIFQTIQLHEARYADANEPEALPWAVAVAVQRQPIDPAAAPRTWAILPLDPALVARSLIGEASTISADVAINLTALLPPDQLTPGAYFYTVALVDRAGNPATTGATGTFTLDTVTYPTISLPLLRR